MAKAPVRQLGLRRGEDVLRPRTASFTYPRSTTLHDADSA